MEIGQILIDVASVDTVFADKLGQIVAKKKIGFENVRKNLSILRSLNTEYLADEAFTKLQTPNKFIQILELLRNSLILVPIALTWYSLSHAVSLFAEQPSSDFSPFLVLWEGGFSGQMPEFLRFSQVALADAVLVGIIILCTLIINVKTHFFDENALKKAMKLKNAVDQLLMEIEEDLYKRYATLAPTEEKNLEAIVAQFDKLATGVETQNRSLLNYITAEQERLSQLSDIQLENTKELQNAATTFYRAASDVVDTIQKLKEEINQLNDLNRKNITLLEQSTLDVSDAIGKISNLTRPIESIKESVEVLNNKHTTTLKDIEKFTDLSRLVESIKESMDAQSNTHLSSSADTRNLLDQVKKALETLNITLETSSQSLMSTNKTLVDVLSSARENYSTPTFNDKSFLQLSKTSSDPIGKKSLQGILAYGSFIPLVGLGFGSITLAWSFAEKIEKKYIYTGLAGLALNIVILTLTTVLIRYYLFT